MNTKVLGTLGLLGAPFLSFNTYLNVSSSGIYTTTPLSGFFDLFYITGWLCSMAGLQQLGAAGTDRLGRIIMPTVLVTLVLANLYNFYEIILPEHDTLLYRTLDLFWPISNLVMIGVGIAVIRARRLRGWKRYIPLMCGLWLPFTMLVWSKLPFGFHLTNAHTALAWTLLALVVFTSHESDSIISIP
ncbi:hypothetical protein [Persicitalea jodogahamensis]|uniref:Uncharacterized protein n=1 Tax=Persicitalea jodogahamensis TaxID=402147 RepID=A0A8J3G9I0_9BACT|nr:hypothetical protein [Persicitalea jodogahamensis]GHB75378.1 hypothetical protein GCM10007390_31390 [Persicitalea jodogahamensis]